MEIVARDIVSYVLHVGCIAGNTIQFADPVSATARAQIEGTASRLFPARRSARDNTLGRELLDDVTG